MLLSMVTTLRRTAGLAFFVLGASFFVAYVLLRNGLWVRETSIWMQSADLPLGFCALVYAGMSVFAGLRHPRKSSHTLAIILAIPLALAFGAILLMNFWPR